MNMPRLTTRQLTDAERVPVFGLASAVLVTLALISLLLVPEHPASQRRHETQTTRRPHAVPAIVRHSVPDRAAALADAREFLTGYLDYLAGGADAQTIPRVSFALRRLLARHRPRRGHGERRRNRVLDVQLASVSQVRASAVATVVDETGATFPIHLRLTAVSDGWEVSSLGR